MFQQGLSDIPKTCVAFFYTNAMMFFQHNVSPLFLTHINMKENDCSQQAWCPMDQHIEVLSFYFLEDFKGKDQEQEDVEKRTMCVLKNLLHIPYFCNPNVLSMVPESIFQIFPRPFWEPSLQKSV